MSRSCSVVIKWQVLTLFIIKTITMSDFLSWDTDLDLDLLLEEYTEYDPNDSDSDDYDCSTAKKKKTNTSATQPSTLTQYKCPVCAKKLKTISGFRGHTQKQHGQNLRASDHHRIASTPDAEPVKTSTSAMSFTDQSFGNVFSASLESTLTNITNDPFISNPDEMRTLCSVVQGSTDINNFLYQTFCNIVSTSTDITLGTDREQLFRRLHKTRISQSIREEFASFFLQHSKNTVNNFLQLIFEDIVGEILVHQTTIAKDNADKEQSMISNNDQSILYYIAGYILRSLRKKYLRYSKHKLSLIDKFSDNSENHNFVQKYERWYKIQNHGGLQKPCDTFFLLVRELELVVRKSVTAKLSANSLLLGPLKENIMEIIHGKILL